MLEEFISEEHSIDNKYSNPLPRVFAEDLTFTIYIIDYEDKEGMESVEINLAILKNYGVQAGPSTSKCSFEGKASAVVLGDRNFSTDSGINSKQFDFHAKKIV